LIAIATQAEQGQPHLFYTSKTALVEFDTYQAVGSGGVYLGPYVLRRAYDKARTTDEAVVLAMQALAAAKLHDTYCGGPSQFLTIRKGVLSPVVPFDVTEAEKEILQYEKLAARLLLEMGGPTTEPPQAFSQRLQAFTTDVAAMRERLREKGLPYEGLV
jgi:hypothetical protein